MSKYQLVDNNANYTRRQLQSAFQPSEDIFVEPTNQVSLFDLTKYKYNYFVSQLICEADTGPAAFGAPSGISILPDDRLLVANFASDNLLLFDINGHVHQTYKIQAPKDVVYYSTNPSQAIVASTKVAMLLDLETGQIVRRSTLKGFYPWHIQFIQEYNIFSACDPSGEQIMFLDTGLNETGSWSFAEASSSPNQPKEKNYPYAACFFSNNTSFVLMHRASKKCELKQCDSRTGRVITTYPTPQNLLAYSICDVKQNKCLIADAGNHSLLLINPDQTFEQYKFPSVREPYSMAFLSDGTLCVTDRSAASGSNGGIAVMTEHPWTNN